MTKSVWCNFVIFIIIVISHAINPFQQLGPHPPHWTPDSHVFQRFHVLSLSRSWACPDAWCSISSLSTHVLQQQHEFAEPPSLRHRYLLQAPKLWGPEGWGPEGWGPELWGPEGWGSEGCGGLKPPGFHTTARMPKRAHFRSQPSKTPPKFHEKTPKRETKRKVAGEGKERVKFWAVRRRGVRRRGGCLAQGGRGPGESKRTPTTTTTTQHKNGLAKNGGCGPNPEKVGPKRERGARRGPERWGTLSPGFGVWVYGVWGSGL